MAPPMATKSTPTNTGAIDRGSGGWSPPNVADIFISDIDSP